MTDMSKKQAEFFAFLILICTVTAAFILLIDFQIKGAILEESNRLRRIIERQSTPANGSRPDNNSHNDTGYPADMVDSRAASVETSGSHHDPDSPDTTQNGSSPQPRRGTRRSPVPD